MSNGKRFGVASVVAFAVTGIVIGGVLVLAFPALATLLKDIFSKTSGTPVRVGDGAMTFRAKAAWQSYTSPSGKIGYCLDKPDLSSITFSPDIQKDSPKGPDSPITLTGEWTMLLHGRWSGDTTKASADFIEMDARHVPCSGFGSGNSLRILGLFYGAHDHPNDDQKKTHSERYLAQDQACLVPGDSDSAQDIIDEDGCEHLSKIELTIMSPDSNPGTYSYFCVNGECEIKIGAY